MKIKYLLMAAFVLPGAMLTACGGDDDDSGNGKEPIDGPTSEQKKTVSKSDSPRDPNFIATASYIQTSWFGEYEGWDAEQQKNTTIQRTLTLQPNGNYTNIIAGKLIESGKDRFYKFESEAGTYTYNNGVVTYTCRYDSVLNYRDQTYTVYNKKHLGKTSEKVTYTENASFTEMKEGMRQWITKDTYLKSLTDDINIDLEFDMSDMSKKK